MPETSKGSIQERGEEWTPDDQKSTWSEDPKMDKLKKEMAGMTVDELLNKAEEYVPNADPFLLRDTLSSEHFHWASEAFIKEARKRMENMIPGPEYDRLVERVDRIQKDFHNEELRFLE